MSIKRYTRMNKIWKLFLFFFIATSMQAQCFLDAKSILKETRLTYHQPKNYFCINPPDSYFSIHPDFNQGPSLISLINNNNQIMISITAVSYPKPIGKINKYLIATVDMNHISKNALVAQMDTRLSKLILIDAPHFKKMNADRGYMYNVKVDKHLYLGIYPRCKKIEIYKDNVARVEILFFYKYGQDEMVKQEIEKTWGMLKFK